MGFTCTGFIAEEDAARFLYWYPSGSLAGVMDQEVRTSVQQAAGEVAPKYPPLLMEVVLSCRFA
jgi:hypothetical protein